MRSRLVYLLRRARVPALVVLDSTAWLFALTVAVMVRLDTWEFSLSTDLSMADARVPALGVLILGVVAAVVHCLLAWVTRMHQGRREIGGFEEMFGLGSLVGVTAVVLSVVNLVGPQLLPRTSILAAAVLVFLLMAWPRAFWRAVVKQPKPNRHGVVTTPVIVAGAGEAGRELVRTMQRDPKQTWHPVAFVDDDPRKKHFRHRGVSVLATTDDLLRAATRTGATTVIIAMPAADSSTISRVNDVARAADLDVKVLPSVHELLDGHVSLADVRDVSPEDLLGRHQVQTDLASIADYLTGRRVLVTGAGGSIGSELCRQIARYSPERLVMLDRDESALHGLLLSMDGRADLESPNVVLADIRDADRIREVFEIHRPDMVFHAAALKHVNMLEQYPGEAVKTNVLGTRNVLDAARATDVARFVNISTDKAADPENALGYSKRIAEGLTAEAGLDATGTYLSVRFGNVLGTRGSVLTTFGAQIAAGGPVTVTDPEVTRFFMTVDEAVQLVIQAAVIGRDGEALVLDMGEPVRIMDVAEQMIELSGERVNIVVTGLKPGEKLHEVLFGADELDDRPVHPLVSHVSVPLVRQSSESLLDGRTAGDIMSAMRFACATMVSDSVGDRKS